jgi:hypothetical protein
MGGVRKAGSVVAGFVLLGLVAAQVGVADGPAPSVGTPFTVAASASEGGVSSALGPDGTVWAVERRGYREDAPFVIVARAANGSTLAPVSLPVAAGSVWDTPVIATSAGTATFVWETQRNSSPSTAGAVVVSARRCTLAGCAPVQTLATWRLSEGGAIAFPTGNPVNPEPAVASVAGGTLVVFQRGGVRAPRMVWAVSDGARFGGLHSFGVAGSGNPALVGESGGRALAAWLNASAGDLEASSVIKIMWSQRSPRSGFTHPESVKAPGPALGGASYAGGLVGTPLPSGAAIAWFQRNSATDDTHIWVARQGPNGLSEPTSAYTGAATGLSLAGADGVLALAFNATAGMYGADDGGPLMVATSVDGVRFGKPVELDGDTAAFPMVAVDAQGDVLASWSSQSSQPSIAQLAIAPAAGSFDPPLTLGPEKFDDGPVAIDANGRQTVVVWENAAGSVLGAAITP